MILFIYATLMRALSSKTEHSRRTGFMFFFFRVLLYYLSGLSWFLCFSCVLFQIFKDLL
ncbi:uncharacterized protein ASPGLDRAFT_666407 [Aspergillus glaucus CBS 516.65]|uniref:Uncharacterized protein n=1 Tax=Aspergillus glaucus CBS 516.65 TaxID=1160497 RepID=A0A1L9VBU8_ASPGL|nr:hypothetical protein ASPGLDRAFT_666407 [Aspergillus glaucus CBS 516.65]OJJ81380.1 hypothetical protein ASPGLDRAFT_666407 [Aspergillus glaucus CBS 516.65]